MKAPMMKIAAALLIMAACGGDGYSPTQPSTPLPLPPPPPPGGSVTGGYSLDFWSESGAGVEEVQVLLDGVMICTGMMLGKWDYGDSCNSGNLGRLAVGRHALSVRVTRAPISPTLYQVSGGVAFAADGVTAKTIATWNEPVSLAIGEAWTGLFEIQE
jgi:hypothetical protein